MRLNRQVMCFLLSFFLLTLCSAGAAKTLYVDDDAIGANDGTSWDNAYTFLQEALGDAKLAEKPVEIRVAQGVYRPNGGLMAIPEFDWRTTTFELINGVTLEGGYAGLGEADPNARDVGLYETILSGDLGDDDGPNFASNSDNSYHVVTGSDTDETAVLDGFTITAGNSDIEGSSPYNQGGGMYTNSGHPTLTNCLFTKNRGHLGGGMFNYRSQPTLNNCTFSENVAIYEGGGIYNSESSVILNNCTLVANSAMEIGGVCNSTDGGSTLMNCIVWGNTSPQIAVNVTVSYSDVQGGWEGKGNIDVDPLFANPDNGDYHLKSQAGRWDAVSGSWVVDEVTSPCIDAGDPSSPVAFEPFPNGGIVNMGAYGGTTLASKSPSGLHAKYGGGTGESNNPYLIYTAEQMNTIGLHAEDWGSHFKLVQDIDLAAYTSRDFNIIGYRRNIQDPSFTGVFDGNGHTISNFTYISTDVDGVALFSYVEGAQVEIRDLGLIDPFIDAGMVNPIFEKYRVEGNSAASLVGILMDGTVKQCYVRGGSISADLNTGGLVTFNHKGTIVDCSSTAEISGFVGIGGLVGYNSRGSIVNCHADGVVTGNDFVGGLVGLNEGTIQNASAIGEIVGKVDVGGLVGKSTALGTIQCSFSTGSVSGIDGVGGLVGRNHSEITDCYSTCSVSGGRSVGGLVGSHGGIITNCYSTGYIVFEQIDDYGDYSKHMGGLVGFADDANDVFQSFWDIETSGRTVSEGGTGLTMTEMQTLSTFLEAGWDFVGEADNGTDDIWWITEGQGYPRLWWERLD
ncbi:MAG: hypothetical protein JXM79_06180 [Sedimentisphaerales bacterium]|nr:hypothetical protein [Sedimentisphaerales bacterium]